MARKKRNNPLIEGVEITSVASEGKALARIPWPGRDDKIVLFVPYAAPGDIADIQIERKKNSYAEGRIERLVKPSELRIDPPCRHFGVCGGCKWQHLPYSAQEDFKRQQVIDALVRIGHLDIPEVNPTLGSKQVYGYRNKMEYTFSNKKWRTREEILRGEDFQDSPNGLGFHIPGAFDKVLHIEECLLQEDIGNRIRLWIYDYAEKHSLSFYNIKENTGLMRSLMIRLSSIGELMVCIQFGEDSQTEISKLTKELGEAFPEITSLLYVINLKANDTIGDQIIHIAKGRDYIEEEMEGLRFRINAKSFYQTNSRQAHELYKVARNFAFRGYENRMPVVYDLYTGAGTIANFVAGKASKVVGIEYVPEAIEDAKLNSRVNNISNTSFYAGDMKNVLTPEFIETNGKPEIVIIDPPRAGMHEDVVKTILATAPEVIVYVSCNPATQARDLALMADSYRITDVQPVDMFPQTHHVENVVRLERISN